jgi:hypothetical protein
MRALNKAGCMALAAGLVLLAAMPANAQQGGVSDDTNEKVVSMNGFSSDTSYIVYLSWQPNGTDANILDIFIHDSATGALLSDIKKRHCPIQERRACDLFATD